MRVSSLLALGACAVVSRADVTDDIEDTVSAASSSVASAVNAATTTTVTKPDFTPYTLKAPFFEQFTEGWESRWQASHAKKEGTTEEWAYVGTWSVEEPTVLKAIQGDKGLVLKDKAAHHAISAKFPKVIDPKDKDLVIQYETKFQGGLECGGAYMKLLQDNSALHAEEFSNASPYIIMFGPDKCGSTNKVHFIFRHKNPLTGEYEEKHMQVPPAAQISDETSLYTLIVKPDQTYAIKIDDVEVRNGSLFEDFVPSVNPLKEIDDPHDSKPEDWVDEETIPDANAVKPEDWDENAPYEIPDEDAVKPADWLDDEPATIPDPEAQKPEDWDDEEDGDWVPPMVTNPKCDEASGCGTWVRPTKRNPNYRGKWKAPKIPNPAYKGAWAPRRIKNPDYYEDKTPANFEPMGAIGFELWTMQNDILFDNIYIGHSVEEAEALARETFGVKQVIESQEKAIRDADDDDDDDEKPIKSPLDLEFTKDPVRYIREKVDLFLAIAKRDPVEAARFVPEVAGGIAVLAVTLLALLVGALGAGSAAAPSKEQTKAKVQELKDSAVAAKDQAAESVSSATETVQAEVNKRTTRSSAQQ